MACRGELTWWTTVDPKSETYHRTPTRRSFLCFAIVSCICRNTAMVLAKIFSAYWSLQLCLCYEKMLLESVISVFIFLFCILITSKSYVFLQLFNAVFFCYHISIDDVVGLFVLFSLGTYILCLSIYLSSRKKKITITGFQLLEFSLLAETEGRGRDRDRQERRKKVCKEKYQHTAGVRTVTQMGSAGGRP